MLERHMKILAYSAAITWTTCCSVYDATLIGEARGGSSAPDGDSDGSGGLGTGGEDDPGGGTGGQNASGGDPATGGSPASGGEPATGGDSPLGGMGGNDTSAGGDGTGGDGTGGSCSMGDCCPDDPAKDEPGECGCGVPDDDSDGDLTADCNDLCPDEATKTEPGDCGCGVTASDEPKCSTLKNGILHRYSFAGTGTEATDSISGQHGTIVGGDVQSGGAITLDGIDQHVSLPAGIISSLTNATFEAWFTWNGGEDYQRVFDFGDTTGSPAVGFSYLYLAASRADGGPGSGFALNGNGNEAQTEATGVLDTGVQYHIALVVDQEGGAINLYIDGAFQNGIGFTSSLANINDINGYLGKSLFEADAYLNGSIDEFRIYDVALSTQQVAYSYAQGADAAHFE